MISDTTRSPNPAGHVGLVENLLALASTLTELFERERKASWLAAYPPKAPAGHSAFRLDKARLDTPARAGDFSESTQCVW